MKFLFKYPTRGRPDQFKQTLSEWIDKLSGKHEYTFMISIDNEDWSMNNPAMIMYLNEFHKDLHIESRIGTSQSKVQAVNADMNEGIEWDILVLVSDDMLPVEEGYDDIIADAMQRYYPDLDGALNFYDGLNSNPDCCTLTIMGRKLYESFGYIYHPSYLGTHCDNEFTDDCREMGKIVWFADCIIEHKWKGVHDELSRRDANNFSTDEANYKARKESRC